MEGTSCTPHAEVKSRRDPFDFIDDSGELFSVIFTSSESLPGCMRKTAHATDRSETAGFDDSAFADPFNRKFLVNTPEHAAASFAYLAAQGVDESDPRTERARKMAFLFGISDQIEEVEKMISSRIRRESRKSAESSADSVWSISSSSEIDGKDVSVSVSGSGPEQLGLVASEVSSKKFACENPPEVVSDFADQILKTASSRGWHESVCDFRDELMLLSGRGCPDRDRMKASIHSRSRLFPSEFGDRISSAAIKAASAEDLSDRDALLGIAFHLGRMDREAGASRHYGTSIPDPLRSVFHHSEDYAVKTASSVKVGSSRYLSCQIATEGFRKAAEAVADLSGIDRSSVPSDPADIPGWVPDGMHDEFARIASDFGVLPR